MLAWTTGIWLIALVYEMVLKYIVKVGQPAELDRRGARLGVLHLSALTANLAVKVRWPIAKTIGILLAGTVPCWASSSSRCRPASSSSASTSSHCSVDQPVLNVQCPIGSLSAPVPGEQCAAVGDSSLSN